ncbi:MAG: TRAM domain-containing protein [Acidobacteria bacterium]|nr:TRAM domain-containing protein [Acidobacteriota bacterium]
MSKQRTGQLTGHSTCHKVVNFEATEDRIGSIFDVTIVEAKRNSLFGKLCQDRKEELN